MTGLDLIMALAAVIATYVFGHYRGFGEHRRLTEQQLRRLHNEAAGDYSTTEAVRRIRMRLFWSGATRNIGPPKT